VDLHGLVRRAPSMSRTRKLAHRRQHPDLVGGLATAVRVGRCARYTIVRASSVSNRHVGELELDRLCFEIGTPKVRRSFA